MRRFLVIASTVFAFGGFSATGAFAAQPTSAKNSVPFKASFSGTATNPSITVLSGKATHFGKSTETISVTQTPVPGTLCNTNIGSVVLTGANGDQIFETTTARTCFNPLTGLVDLNGTQRITNGTGRFEGASGKLTVAGTINPATDEISTSEEGSISY